jgi:hypothetical protein
MPALGYHHWPSDIPAPDPREDGWPSFVLVRIPAIRRNPEGKCELRRVIARILENWKGGSLALSETCCGPVTSELIQGRPVFISIAYCDDNEEAWLGIGLGVRIGVDAVSLFEFPEWEAVADLYLGKATRQTLQKARHPFREFALAWAAFEAALKCAQMPLAEGTHPPQANIQTVIVLNTVLAVASPTVSESSFIKD